MIIMIKGSWYRVPEQVLTDKRLTLADAAAFAYIADKCDGSSHELSCAEIATETGYSIKTIKRAVSKLEDCHYIAVEHRAGSASIYRQLLMPAKRSAPHRRATAAAADVSKYEVAVNRFLRDYKDEEATG